MMDSTCSLMGATEIVKWTLFISLVSTAMWPNFTLLALRFPVMEMTISTLILAMMEMQLLVMDAHFVQLTVAINATREILSLMMFAKRFVGMESTWEIMNVMMETTTVEMDAHNYALLKRVGIALGE